MIAASPAQTAPVQPGRLGLILEIALVMGVLISTKLIFDQVAWKYAGPISLAFTLATIGVITCLRKESWSSFGLRRLRRWWSFPLILPQGLLATIAIIGIGAGTAYLGDFLGFWSVEGDAEGVEARWGNIQGNLPVYLTWLAIAWTSAAFGEEIFFRGYLIDRVGKLLPDARWASFVSILIPALIFGIAHAYYQGIQGLFTTGMIGLALGALYLLNKRNLWPNILAHGIVDTLAFTAMYLNLDI
ncbi:CPBP family intramembrane glutamic endopeptidase [Maricaulis parjimensis]|uniref:CPBP family intramembrane glutamic endopeptidase n=1 Tax=Maricaulis parjimensis TaxID=144023 RepID=UPI001939F712|nr:CPBP family intramembrane glutamic endopeptidase [Maricaulis parjimensis]